MNFTITKLVPETVMREEHMNFNLYTYIAYRLEEARQAKNIKVIDLHRMLPPGDNGKKCIAETTLRKIFRGESDSVRVSYLCIIAKVLDISFGSLFPQEFLDGKASIKGREAKVPEWRENNAVT